MNIDTFQPIEDLEAHPIGTDWVEDIDELTRPQQFAHAVDMLLINIRDNQHGLFLTILDTLAEVAIATGNSDLIDAVKTQYEYMQSRFRYSVNHIEHNTEILAACDSTYLDALGHITHVRERIEKIAEPKDPNNPVVGFLGETNSIDRIDANALLTLFGELYSEVRLQALLGRAKTAASIVDYLPQELRGQYEEALRIQLLRRMLEVFNRLGMKAMFLKMPMVWGVLGTRAAAASTLLSPIDPHRVDLERSDDFVKMGAAQIYAMQSDLSTVILQKAGFRDVEIEKLEKRFRA